MWPRLLTALRRSSRLGREIALVLLIKTVLLALLFNRLSPGPAPGRVDAGLAEQHLLGSRVGAAADDTNSAEGDPHGR